MISVVIPSYNRKDSVLRLLADVYRQEGVIFEVIVVDDHSLDGTVEAISAAFPRTIVLRNEANRGPAVTRNRGVRRAEGEIVVGFDSDVTVSDARLLEKVGEAFAEMPSLSGLAFRLLQPDGKTEDVARWWHPVPLERFAHKRFLTSYFSGTAYAFRRHAMVDAGLFPEILFMHYEEVELAYRILDSGRSIMYWPDLVVLHHAHPVATRSEIKVFYKPRNQLLLTVACLPVFQALRFLVPRLAYQLISALVHGHLGAFFRAMRDACAKIPERLRERRPLKAATFRRMAELRQGLFV